MCIEDGAATALLDEAWWISTIIDPATETYSGISIDRTDTWLWNRWHSSSRRDTPASNYGVPSTVNASTHAMPEPNP